MKRIFIIGGYGNFGRLIATSLALDNRTEIVVAGRNPDKAQALAEEINAGAAVIDIRGNLPERLREIGPDIVIHTSGPFQSQAYSVAEACIECGAHYIDLADGREFVAGIDRLDAKARSNKVLVVSGASSVPCLTSALTEHYRAGFKVLEALDYGITTAQKTTRGLATTAAILSYVGKPFETLINGRRTTSYGWQDLHARKYSGLGWRLLGNCDIPDLELFPKICPSLKTVRFYAGLELPFIHITLWALSWLVRAGLVRSLKPSAPLLLRLSFLFDWLGSANSGFYMDLSGQDEDGRDKTIHFELTARNGDGLYIPCMPAILIARKLASNELRRIGATPCVGIISKEEYLDALRPFDIDWTDSTRT